MNYSWNRFEVHSHTEYSNASTGLDSINKIDKLIDRAIEIGLSGIAITDHDCLASHVKVNKYAQEILKEHPDFKVALGNEVYLCKDRSIGQPDYYHCVLIAKNKIGHRALRELSSRAWMLGYEDRRFRTVTTYDDIEEMAHKYPHSFIMTTACIGGELSKLALKAIAAKRSKNDNEMYFYQQAYFDFANKWKNLLGDDFYIECAPGTSTEQVAVNRFHMIMAKALGIKMVIGTDAHYLKKEDRYIHKAYLTSHENKEREVDAFYEFAYLQENDEIIEHLAPGMTMESIENCFVNSMEIYNKIENYSLFHAQTIPKVRVKDYPPVRGNTGRPTLDAMMSSYDIMNRYWVNECVNKLTELGRYNDIYLDRLEEEADTKKIIGEKLGTNMFRYPITLQHYINLIWECGSTLGAGRGSSCAGLNHYLLGVTQLDPIQWDLPWFRYMNRERVELGDIDIDICSSKRPLILKKIKEERSQDMADYIDDLSRNNLGCTMVATFGSEKTKSAVISACRGYRSEEYPDGIDVDTAQYLSTLIPQERGFVWDFHDVVEGNPDKDRKPITTFINEVGKYPGLLDIMRGIEGMVNHRGIHASGVILFDEDPYEFGCFMRAPSGEITTQYDLHDAEAVGMTKYDFLVTEVQDKLTTAIELLQKYNQIEQAPLKEIYNKYFHPDALPLNDENVWKAIQSASVLDLFQFDSDVGRQGAKKVKPKDIYELADTNGLIRLMTAEKGAEMPLDKYVRFKNNINLWYQEMNDWGLTQEEQKVLEPYFKSSFGVPPSQEQLMRMLMDENICHFSLKDANSARKIVGKKQMTKIPVLHQQVLDQAASEKLGTYVWKYGIGPQMGYAFSIIHALAYSFIGFQTAYIATRWNPIYWNTACLIVNSASLEDNSEEEVVSIYAPEKEDIAEGVTFEDLPDRSGKIRKTASVDYAKIAKAIGATRSLGINVSLIDINRSSFGFEPDEENNQILFGMNGLSGINQEDVERIMAGRPYVSIKDFMQRCPIKKPGMISLIKAGAFDTIDKEWAEKLHKDIRPAVMAYYIMQISEPKSKLNLQNFNGLIQRDMLPESLSFQKRVYIYNQFLKKNCAKQFYYVLSSTVYDFYQKFFDMDQLKTIAGKVVIDQKKWEKQYKAVMTVASNYLKDNQEEMLWKYNQSLFSETWNKYAKGSISAWEMQSLCFYHHEHELAHVNTEKYGISDYQKLPQYPEVETYYRRAGREIPIYSLTHIVGTVIAKNDTKSSISLLTPTGVVAVKFTKEYYAQYKKQLSELQPDGSKKIIERSWFARGTKLFLTGFRREDTFVAKAYSKTPTHQIYQILDVDDNGDIRMIHDRAAVEAN